MEMLKKTNINTVVGKTCGISFRKQADGEKESSFR